MINASITYIINGCILILSIFLHPFILISTPLTLLTPLILHPLSSHTNADSILTLIHHHILRHNLNPLLPYLPILIHILHLLSLVIFSP